MGRSRSGRRGPFSTGRPEYLRIIGREHDERSASHTRRVISARMVLYAARERAYFDWSVAECSTVARKSPLRRHKGSRETKESVAVHERAGARTFDRPQNFPRLLSDANVVSCPVHRTTR